MSQRTPTTVEDFKYELPADYQPPASLYQNFCALHQKGMGQGITISLKPQEATWAFEICNPLKVGSIIQGGRTLVLRLFSFQPHAIQAAKEDIAKKIGALLGVEAIPIENTTA